MKHVVASLNQPSKNFDYKIGRLLDYTGLFHFCKTCGPKYFYHLSIEYGNVLLKIKFHFSML